MPEPLPKHRIYTTLTQGTHPPSSLIECACGWHTEWQESHAEARSLYNDHEVREAKRQAVLDLIEWGRQHGFPQSLEEALQMDAADGVDHA